jgi:hypothetical protein
MTSLRMLQTRTRREPGESSFGFFRQVLSTRIIEELQDVPGNKTFRDATSVSRMSCSRARTKVELKPRRGCHLLRSR